MGVLQYRFIIFYFLSFVIYFNANATHNRAGEITYKWVGPSLYRYEIKITTYTNIGGTNLADRCEDTLYFGDGTRAVVLRSNGTTYTMCSSGATDGVAISSSIKVNEYVTYHNYPGPGNYKMSMEDPNRNSGVINIPNSVNQVFYIESFLVIPTFGSVKNSSPILTFPPIDNGCMTQCFYHNPGAYDMDGDSLSYELTTCRGSGGATCPGYSYPGTGGGLFNLDSLTGTLTWCSPQLQGEYNLAMIIKEWRLDGAGNYFMVGYIERDMQIDVGSCNNNPPQIVFNNLDTCILAGTSLTNSIQATDLNGDNITLSANGAPFVFISNPATFSSSPSNSTTSGIFNWNTDSTHIRKLPYQVTLKVKDNNPMISLVHFKTFNVKVIPYAPRNLSTIPFGNSILLKWNKASITSLATPNSFARYKVYRKNGLSNWIHTNTETAPPAYTGFVYIGNTSNNINDTLFYDNNGGNSFISGQDYSYLILTEYTDGATSYASNISSAQAVVGLNELSLNNKIQISPNPVTENLTVTFNQNNEELFSIELFDITGRKIKTFTTNESLSKHNQFVLNLETIQTGIYFLKFIGSNNTSVTKKIIKQ